MTDSHTPDPKDPRPAPRAQADRIAKVMARAGVASRREAERMIVEGRVSVNGKTIDSPALDVQPGDRIIVDGKKLDEPQETRLWLYYKPLGLVTSEADEKGRQTVFDALPRDLPRVMTVGRLDLNSEGLLLLTNDGELKRRLELPSTGWLRRYRVRVNGTPSDMTFDPLRRGVTIEGEDFAPMEIKLDSQQGANAWITVGIREGKNREIRRAMAHVGLQVNRLIRIGYGPFKLTGMDKNEVVEVKRKVLRDQLGGLLTGEAEEKTRVLRPRGAEGTQAAGRRDGSGTERPRPAGKTFGDRGDAARGPDQGGSRPARSWGAASGTRDDRPRLPAKPGDARPTSGDRTRPTGDKPRWKKPAPAGGDRRQADASPRQDGPPRFRGPEGKAGDSRRPSASPRGEGAEAGRKTLGKPRGAPTTDARKPPYHARGEGAEGERKFAGKPRGDLPTGARKPSYQSRGEGTEGARKPFGKPRGDDTGGGRKTFGAAPGTGPKSFGKPKGASGGGYQGKPRPGGPGKGIGGARSGRPEGTGKPRGPRG